MTHYIRTKNNYTIVDLDASNDDFQVVIVIENYTKKLLSLPENIMGEFMDDVSYIQELRGVWFERVESEGEISMRDFIKLTFEEIAEKWNLLYITD